MTEITGPVTFTITITDICEADIRRIVREELAAQPRIAVVSDTVPNSNQPDPKTPQDKKE